MGPGAAGRDAPARGDDMHVFSRVLARATFSLTCAVVVSGCAPIADDPVGEAASEEIVANGLHLNGLHLNGLHLNGLHLNGLHLNGLHLNGVHIDGLHLNGRRLGDLRSTGARLEVVRAGGRAIGAVDLTGTEVTATAQDGTSFVLRIDAVAPGIPAGVVLYTISYRDLGSTSFKPICGTENGAPIPVIPLSGSWDDSAGTPTGGSHIADPGAVTLACRGFALAKCVELGYVPGRSVQECRAPGECRTRPLSAYHQACTRMLRADYCGDGTATTRDGTLVDVWDNLSIQTDDASTWSFEAEWTPNGASCVKQTRWPTIVDEGEAVATYIQDHCPGRWHTQGCGAPSSKFFTANGFTLLPARRPLLRTRIDHEM